MKTLEQLIHEDLPVGALAIHETGAFIQLHLNNIFFIPVMDEYLSVNSYFYTSDKWKPTTAHDAGIDPETLPIPEPFWTGWVVSQNGPCEVLEFVKGKYWPPEGFDEEGYQEPNYFRFKDGSGCYESDCKPCLPPK